MITLLCMHMHGVASQCLLAGSCCAFQGTIQASSLKGSASWAFVAAPPQTLVASVAPAPGQAGSSWIEQAWNVRPAPMPWKERCHFGAANHYQAAWLKWNNHAQSWGWPSGSARRSFWYFLFSHNLEAATAKPSSGWTNAAPVRVCGVLALPLSLCN